MWDAEFCAVIDIVETRHVIVGIVPCVKITSPKQDAFLAKDAVFDMLRRRRIPKRSRRMVVQMEQLLYSRKPFNSDACLKILVQENLFYAKKERWGQITP